MTLPAPFFWGLRPLMSRRGSSCRQGRAASPPAGEVLALRPFKRRWRYMPRSTRKCPSFNAIRLQAEWQLEHACHGRSTAPEELKPGVEQGLNLPFLPLPGGLRRRLRPPLPCRWRVSKPAPRRCRKWRAGGHARSRMLGPARLPPPPPVHACRSPGSLPGRMGQPHGQTQGHHAGGPALGRLEAVEGMPALTPKPRTMGRLGALGRVWDAGAWQSS